MALTQSTDLNNQTAESTVAGWNTITNTEGFRAIDVDNDGVDNYFYSEWDKDTYSINQFYERMKWLTRRGSSETIYGLNGNIFRGITHEIPVDNPSGTFQEPEPVSWSSGTGQILAINSTTAPTKMWIQLLTGIAPSDNTTITGDTSGATCDVNGSFIERKIDTPFVGASTGSSIIGAYGLGIKATNLTASDKLFDLDNNAVTPPNYVTFTVGGLVANEDRVLVAPEQNGSIQTDQLSVDGNYNGGETTFTVKEDIPSDTPSSGTIRVWNGDTFSRVTYTGWSGKSFTGCSGVPACNDNDNVFISYIDDLITSGNSLSFTSVYDTDRSLFIRVRDGGNTPIKTFETTGTLGSAGGNATAIRTSDE